MPPIVVVDLITPPSSPEAAPLRPTALGKRKSTDNEPLVVEDDSNSDDCHEVERPVQPALRGVATPYSAAAASSTAASSCAMAASSSISAAPLTDDDELEFLGRTGDNALEDFPHARENCAAVPFGRGDSAQALKHCPQCFCFVCDATAASCVSWPSHCVASHTKPYWRQQRQLFKQRGGGKATGAATAAGASATPRLFARPPVPTPATVPLSNPLSNHFASSSTTAVAFTASTASSAATSSASSASPASATTDDMEEYSCERLLREVQQVHPIEASAPAGLLSTVRLKPYQKQSLAFMLELERSTDPALTGRPNLTSYYLHECDELRKWVGSVDWHANKKDFEQGGTRFNPRSRDQYSLAKHFATDADGKAVRPFLHQEGRAPDKLGHPVRGGWLCDESAPPRNKHDPPFPALSSAHPLFCEHLPEITSRRLPW